MKKTLTILISTLAVLVINAQMPESSDFKTRLGTKDPAKAQELVRKIFNDDKAPMKRGNERIPVTRDFYRDFKELTTLAPFCTYSLYHDALYYGETSPLTRLMDSIPDPAAKMVILEDFLHLGHNFIDHLDSINLLRKYEAVGDAKKPLSPPVGMIKYAHMYYQLARNPKYYPTNLYDKTQARDNFRTAFERLRELNIDPGTEVEGIYLNEYYNTCEALFRTDEARYYEQFLSDYLEIIRVCDNLLIPYYDIPDSIKLNPNDPEYRMFNSYNYWTNHPGEGIKALFKNSGAATPERLNDYYLAHLDEHKTDTAYLNNAITMLSENEAMQTKAFYDYCRVSHKVQPTYLNCIGNALFCKEGEMYDDMVNYYQEALDLADNNLQKGLIAYQIGTHTNAVRPKDMITGKAVQRGSIEFNDWSANLMRSMANLRTVLEVQDAFRTSPSTAIRAIPSHASYQLGLALYRYFGVLQDINLLNEAISYIQMAKQANPTAYNTNADGMINNINNTRQKLLAANRNAAQLKKQHEEYQAYLRKKAEEEAFWKGSK